MAWSALNGKWDWATTIPVFWFFLKRTGTAIRLKSAQVLWKPWKWIPKFSTSASPRTAPTVFPCSALPAWLPPHMACLWHRPNLSLRNTAPTAPANTPLKSKIPTFALVIADVFLKTAQRKNPPIGYATVCTPPVCALFPILWTWRTIFLWNWVSHSMLLTPTPWKAAKSSSNPQRKDKNSPPWTVRSEPSKKATVLSATPKTPLR